MSPLPVSPLAVERQRTRASSVSTFPLGVEALPDSPQRTPVRRSRRGSVIVYSNPNSGASTPKSGEWDHFTEQPTFWNSRFGWINQPEKIRVLSTESDSSLGDCSDLATELYWIVDEKDTQSSNMAAEELSKNIANLKKIYGAIKLNYYYSRQMT